MLALMWSPDVSVRPAVAALPRYVPGARPRQGERLLKLSSNENPFPPLPSVVVAIADAALTVNRYPDLLATALTEAIAELHGCGPDRVVAGNGSVAVLQHVLETVCEAGDEVVFAWRSFEAYPIASQIVGAVPVAVPLRPDGRHDLVAMAAAVSERTRAVLLCSPNNPTGPALRAGEVRSFLASVPADVLVVLDEAYVEFIRDPDAADGPDLLIDHPNVVVLRTFSKAYGLAGLRLGYALAEPRLAAAVQAVATPFGVNALAQVAGLAALRARGEALMRVETLVVERERVTTALADLGWHPPDAQGNFVWLPVGDRTIEFAQRARAQGILVRPFAAEGVRVSVSSAEENDAFLALVGEWA